MKNEQDTASVSETGQGEDRGWGEGGTVENLNSQRDKDLPSVTWVMDCGYSDRRPGYDGTIRHASGLNRSPAAAGAHLYEQSAKKRHPKLRSRRHTHRVRKFAGLKTKNITYLSLPRAPLTIAWSLTAGMYATFGQESTRNVDPSPCSTLQR